MTGAGPVEPLAKYEALQQRLTAQFRDLFTDDLAPRTVVILPSLTLDEDILGKVEGAIHYEQRLLCLLFLLRFPHTHVVYLTSEPIPTAIVDYYLHLLPGVPHGHARRRLALLSCYDGTARSLTDKILQRPRLMARITAAIPDINAAHITCFNVTERERELALRLELPIYGCDPSLTALGTKSGSRALFRATGVLTPDGAEGLASASDIVEALAELRARDRTLRKAVVKLNDGFSGEGNAIFDFAGAPSAARDLRIWIAGGLRHMVFVAPGMTWPEFEAALAEMGGIAEAFVAGEEKRLPSVQYRVDPDGTLDIVSTHDQLTGGEGDQVFEGCRFPADPAYAVAIRDAGQAAAEALRDKGVLGRFGIDFISVRDGDDWRHFALEVNLRKGGTTHPFLMLQHLTDGEYDANAGVYRSRSGQVLCYRASDNVSAPDYRGLTPDDVIDIAVDNALHFNPITQEGVAFHLLGAVSSYGKFGVTCVAGSPAGADALYRDTVRTLDAATKAHRITQEEPAP